MEDILIPDGYTPPGDLVNLGHKCRDCGSKYVVYQNTKTTRAYKGGRLVHTFPPGAYCYKCLVNHARALKWVPTPIELTMADRVETAIGQAPPPLRLYFPPR